MRPGETIEAPNGGATPPPFIRTRRSASRWLVDLCDPVAVELTACSHPATR
jgi:hypothetical protein